MQSERALIGPWRYKWNFSADSFAGEHDGWGDSLENGYDNTKFVPKNNRRMVEGQA